MIIENLVVFVRQFFLNFFRPNKETDFAQELSEQIGYFARQTPSHLSGYLSADCPELGLGQGGHGEDIAIGYRLTCSCGEQKFEVTAYLWTNPDFDQETLLSPVTAVCSDCKNIIVVFDSRVHGYDCVVCDDTTTLSGEEVEGAIRKKLSSLEEPETVDIVLYYTDDLFDVEFDGFVKADCFTWITVVVGTNTSPKYPLLSFECA